MLNRIFWNRTICIKMDLALNNPQGLMCHKSNQPTNLTDRNLSLLTTTLLFNLLTKVDMLLLWILRSITKDLWIYLMISTPMNRYPYKLFWIISMTFTKIISNADKSWYPLINYHSIIPKIYGLPKTHKPDIPLRPIISATGLLAKILFPLLSAISDANMNSG